MKSLSLHNCQLSQETTYEDLNRAHGKKKSGQLKESELRGLLFEVAMYTMVLMVETCSGLYHYWIHKHFQQHIAIIPLKDRIPNGDT
jgi:hypothetical protein